MEKWTKDYHTKVEFFFDVECKSRGVVPKVKQEEVVWFHGARNEQYHVGGASVPDQRVLGGVRAAALEVFSVLFDERDVSLLLEEHIAVMSPPPPPPRSDLHDRLIDRKFDMIEVCGQEEYASEVLYALDADRYRELALELETGVDAPTEEQEGEIE